MSQRTPTSSARCEEEMSDGVSQDSSVVSHYVWGTEFEKYMGACEDFPQLGSVWLDRLTKDCSKLFCI